MLVIGKGNFTGTTYDGFSTSYAATYEITKGGSAIKLAAPKKAPTFTGKAIALNGATSKSGSSAAPTYAYFSDAKCAKPVDAAKAVKAWKATYVAKTKKVNVTVPKGTKKGAYEMKPSVTADGKVNKVQNYASATKPATVYIKVG